VNSLIMRRRKVISRRKKTAIKAMLTLKVPRLQDGLDQAGFNNRINRGGGAHRRMNVTINQAAKKIPIALASWPGALA